VKKASADPRGDPLSGVSTVKAMDSALQKR